MLFCGQISCTTVTSTGKSQPLKLSWAERQRQLQAMESWQLQGAVAIHTPQDSGSVSLAWKQTQQNYTLSLFGPLGSNAVQITGKPGLVTLQTAQGKQFYAPTAEQLLHDQTGWNLPISSLYYWTRGLPVPSSPSTTTFDDQHRLSTLTQQNWQIVFSNYAVFQGIELPTRIALSYPQLNIKMVIYQWNL